MKRDGGPAGDLVADHQCRQGLAAGEFGQRLGESRERRHGHDADVTLGRIIAVMAVEIVDLGGDRIGGARQTDAAAVEQHPCGMSGIGRRIEQRRGFTGDQARFHRGRRAGDAQGVEEEQRRPVEHLGGKGFGIADQREIDHAPKAAAAGLPVIVPLGQDLQCRAPRFSLWLH